MKRARASRWLVLGVLTAAFFALVAYEPFWRTLLEYFFPDQGQVLHPQASLLVFVWQHLQLIALSSLLSITLGVSLGVWVTRESGRSFLFLANDFTSFGQTFPPVAVLALAVPALGFGFWPTVVALFLYGLLPIARNTIAGINSVPPATLDAACGMGMGSLRILGLIELPLAARFIIAGIRVSVVINIGTAMIGAIIGAGGLGIPIVAGLVQNNLAFVLEGAIPAALMAILADQVMANVEASLEYPVAQT